MVNNMRRQDASSALGDMGDRADKMAQQQKDTANKLTQAYGNQAPDPRQLAGAGTLTQRHGRLIGTKIQRV